MAAGYLYQGVCYTSLPDAVTVVCAAEFPQIQTLSASVTRSTSCLPYVDATGGALSLTITTRDGVAIQSSVTGFQKVSLGPCDTDKDYAGGLSLITKTDAVAVAWGIVGAWLLAAGLVWIGRVVRG